MTRQRYRLPNFRIAVIGSGAIGSYYGAKLAYYGRDVRFLMRNDLVVVRKRGITVRSKMGNFRVAKVNAHASTAEIGPSDLVLIAIKATSNNELLELIPPLLHEKTMLLTLQNGFGNDDFLAENFGAERVLGGLCFVCVSRVEPGVIEHYDYGRIALGEYHGYPLPRTHDIAWEFKRCGVTCMVVESLALERWRKLVWNIPFNGLSLTCGGVDTAEILTNDRLRADALALMDEVITAAGKCGHFLPPAEALAQMKRTEEMGNYKPSTLIDFEAHKPIEIEAIWGEPLRRATAAGAKMPRLEELYAQLRELDAQNRAKPSFAPNELDNVAIDRGS
jgi:2-dehydropantoate 2-reductase